MPSSKTESVPTYKIFMDGKTHRGTARELIELIRADAATRSESIAKEDADEYASSLVNEAPYALNSDYLRYLSKEKYATKYDRALRYLVEMDPGVRILRQEPGTTQARKISRRH